MRARQFGAAIAVWLRAEFGCCAPLVLDDGQVTAQIDYRHNDRVLVSTRAACLPLSLADRGFLFLGALPPDVEALMPQALGRPGRRPGSAKEALQQLVRLSSLLGCGAQPTAASPAQLIAWKLAYRLELSHVRAKEKVMTGLARSAHALIQRARVDDNQELLAEMMAQLRHASFPQLVALANQVTMEEVLAPWRSGAEVSPSTAIRGRPGL